MQQDKMKINADEIPSDKESGDPLLEQNMDEIAAANLDRARKRRVYIAPFIAVQVIGLVAIILIFVWIFKYLGGMDLKANVFNLHPFLMVIGFVYLFGNSILIYRVFWQNSKYIIKLAHSAVNAFALICAGFGIWAAFASHNYKNIPNLYSLHSWIGLITVGLFAVQLVGGFLVFLIPVTPASLRKFSLPYHVFTGLSVFACAIVACISGLNEKAIFTMGSTYGDLPPAAFLINFIGVVLVVFAALVIFLATREGFRRPSSPEETALYRQETGETQFS